VVIDFVGLCMICSNEMPCIVLKLSYYHSVLSIWPCIQLHNSACNVLQIWLLPCLQLQCQYLRTSVLLNNTVPFDSLSTGITQHSNSNHHVSFCIFEQLIARDNNIFQKWRSHYWWFEEPYFASHIWWLGGIYKYVLDAFYCLEIF